MSASTPPPAAVARLRLWPTVVEGLALVFANFAALAKLALWPLLLSLAADFALMASFQDPLLYSVVKLLLLNLIWVLFAVPWLRLLLLEEDRDPRAATRLTRDHGRFVLYALIIVLFDLALSVGYHLAGGTPEDAVIPGLGYWLAFLAIAFAKLRFSFVYPAVATGESYSLALAWRHSTGSGAALFGAQLLAVFIPVIALSFLLNHALAAAATQAAGTATFGLWILSHAVLWPLEGAYLALIAVAFRRCTGWVPPADKTIVERFE